jgi:hypothetical protein
MTSLPDELRRLAGKVTPGPWVWCGCSLSDFGREYPCSMSMEWIPNGSDEGDVNAKVEADAALIVLLRNNLDTIISALEAQEKPE